MNTQPVDNMRQPKKSWRYFVDDPTRQSWGAVIVLDSSGVFLAFSDYGTFGYRWTHPGCDDIRDFFIRSRESIDYFLSKFSPGESYWHDGTQRAIREQIIKLRRKGQLDAEEARAEWKLTESTLGSECDMYAHWYPQTHLPGAEELTRYRPNQQAMMFCTTIMPAFADLLRMDLAIERSTPPPTGRTRSDIDRQVAEERDGWEP